MKLAHTVHTMLSGHTRIAYVFITLQFTRLKLSLKKNTVRG